MIPEEKKKREREGIRVAGEALTTNIRWRDGIRIGHFMSFLDKNYRTHSLWRITSYKTAPFLKSTIRSAVSQTTTEVSRLTPWVTIARVTGLLPIETIRTSIIQQPIDKTEPQFSKDACCHTHTQVHQTRALWTTSCQASAECPQDFGALKRRPVAQMNWWRLVLYQ